MLKVRIQPLGIDPEPSIFCLQLVLQKLQKYVNEFQCKKLRIEKHLNTCGQKSQ